RSEASRCRHVKRDGQRCKRRAGVGRSDGVCIVHAGEQDMRALGRRGGMTRGRRALGIDAELPSDAELLELVRQVFWQTMNDSNATTGEKLRAASALHSFRATEPPRSGAEDVSSGYGRETLPPQPELLTA